MEFFGAEKCAPPSGACWLCGIFLALFLALFQLQHGMTGRRGFGGLEGQEGGGGRGGEGREIRGGDGEGGKDD